MDYAVYFEDAGEVLRLPVNPEEISRDGSMDTEQYRMLTGEQVAIPVGRTLTEISFDTEFPYGERHYTNNGFQDADTWLDRLGAWRKKKVPIRFIACNGISEDINLEVLVTQVQGTEKAGEEGDRYVSLTLLEYVAPMRRYVNTFDTFLSGQAPAEAVNPAVAGGSTHTVTKGDTLWGIAKKYYGNGGQYQKVFQENRDKIKNPNLIYPGQILVIPA